MKKVNLMFILLCLVASSANAQTETTEPNAKYNNSGEGSQVEIYTEEQQKLRLTGENIRLVPDTENGGYHLYVKKLPNINSILLTETTKDPTGKNASYAYRAKEYNPINGDEVRYLDGKPLVSEGAKYSLLDSTTENTAFFGEAFHIYIPETIVYGYEWSRHGEIKISKGTFINVRTFEKPYADYSGNFMDSPFMFNFIPKKKKPLPEPEPIIEEPVLTDDYNPLANDAFKEIAGDVIYSKGPETIIQDIHELLADTTENIDVVFCIDATGSMKNDIDKLKKDLQPELQELFGKAINTDKGSTVRVGLLFYRDYGDTYKYMDLPVKLFAFTDNLNSFNANLNSVKITGREGGDIPEAVYEAMYAASEYFKWRPDVTKKIILIGDAEPHPTPRGSGKYSKDFVMKCAKAKGITIRSILLPKD